MNKDLSKYTIKELSLLLKNNKLDPLDLLNFFNEKIVNHQDQSVFISRNEDNAS